MNISHLRTVLGTQPLLISETAVPGRNATKTLQIILAIRKCVSPDYAKQYWFDIIHLTIFWNWTFMHNMAMIPSTTFCLLLGNWFYRLAKCTAWVIIIEHNYINEQISSLRGNWSHTKTAT